MTRLAAGLLALAGLAAAAEPPVSAEAAWKLLLEGSARFARGAPAHPRQDAARRTALINTQHPFAAVLACTDSRVPPEIVFDQGLGDMFVCRTAGQVIDDAVLGSMDFAVDKLGIKLVVVLGHQNCGAVAAVLKGGEQAGHIGMLLDAIKPAVDQARTEGGDLLEHSVDDNIALVARKLKAAMVQREGVRVQRARYDHSSGRVVTLAGY